MQVALFGAKSYDRQFFEEANQVHQFSIEFLEPHLNKTTVALADGADAVCVFVNDVIDAPVLKALAEKGIHHLALRCSGYNNVDLNAARQYGVTVSRVPAYSPHAVAEHTIALLLALNRKVHRAHNRVHEGNFSLEGLLGFDLYGLTAGVIGTGNIGMNVVRILLGFGCKVLTYDPYPDPQCEKLGAEPVDLHSLLSQSDIVTLHCPLTPESRHLINQDTIQLMKTGVTLLNTSRGALIDTQAVVNGLKSGKIGYLGLDVYEEEGDIFFEDLSSQVIQDDVFARLMTFPNVIVTGHQGFFTRNALQKIAATTLANIAEFARTGHCKNRIAVE